VKRCTPYGFGFVCTSTPPRSSQPSPSTMFQKD
jgi:hypothetical protein